MRRQDGDSFFQGYHQRGRLPLLWRFFRSSTTSSFLVLTLLATLREPSLGYASSGQRTEESQGPGKAAGFDVGRRNMIKAIAELYKEEMKRQEEISLEEAILCDNGPKEISIFCHQAPEVKIVDLAPEHRGNNECLILNINAPDVSSQMVLKCDGTVAGDDFGWGEDW